MRLLRLALAAAAFTVPFVYAGAPAASTKKKITAKAPAKRAPAVAPAVKEENRQAVQASMSDAVELGVQNPAAMVPFYELLFRQKTKPSQEPLRILQFGDSHTASDDWCAALRARFQQEFGDGGPGFTHAGRPFLGFRRYDSHSAMSRGWKPHGLLGRDTDGLHGIPGVSLTSARAGETLTFEAEGERLEVFYLQQPSGGAFTIEDNDTVLDTVQTDGALSAGYYSKTLAPGLHHLVLRTASSAEVRVYGWVLEKQGGLTWETLGVNGAQIDLLLERDPELFRSQLARRNPALVVLAFGTNEVRRTDWTYDSYRTAVTSVIRLIREASPTTSILVIGAPDQGLRSRRRLVTIPESVDKILMAQRDAALANGCAFWNLRAAMGGKGSMKQWVQAGLAQGDYVHLTTAGYRLVGDSLYELIMGQYGIFQTVRRQLLGTNDNGTTNQNH